MRALVAVLFVLGMASSADATRHRRPHHPDVALNAGYDNNGGAAGCVDSMCGGNCYNGHTGNDFNLGVGNAVLASAGGTVSEVVQGCPDYGYYCSPCGGRCGNHVRIRHPDGSSSLYCHLRNGSVRVRVGQGVGCGDQIAESASSGCSTGPHLHWGWYPGGSADPYSGRCSNRGGAWVDQGVFGRSPSPACENNCDCNPGQVQEDGCGNCGRRRRTCQGNCRWGGWSGCEGQGPCSPGQMQSEACCDCGTRTRRCGGNCQWDGWGACGGPDPPGAPECPTGKPGDCAIGALRCVEGCVTCVDTVFPTPERCDARDNDCDGPTDEEATELADPPPPFAATLEDLSAPAALRPGERAEVWAVFRNVGSAPWPATATWVGARGPEEEAGPPLRDPEHWSAHDVAVGLSRPVPPGGTATVVFPVRMPSDGAPPEVSTRFDLAVRGAPIMCPEPGFELALERLAPGAAPADAGPDAADDAPDAASQPALDDSAHVGGGCNAAPGPAAWLPFALLALARRRR